MIKFLIYGLVDPRTSLVRYIGQSSSGMRRPKHHRNASQLRTKPGHRSSWIKALQRLELDYEIVVLEALESAELLNDAERWWISIGRAFGWDLTNATDGGDGTRGLKFSDEHRAKISIANTGKKHTLEQRALIVASLTGRPCSTATRLKIGANWLGRKHSEASLAKMRLAHAGQTVPQEQRERQRIAMTGYKFGPKSKEIKQKISAALKGRPMMGRPRNPPRFRINLLSP